jgi:integrase
MAPQLTLRDCVALWLEGQRDRIREPTWVDYAEKARHYVLPSVGHLPLQDVRTEHLTRLYQRMQARGLSFRTVRYTHQIVHHALQHAVSLQLIPANPARDARPKTPSPQPAASLKPEELRRFLLKARSSEHAGLWFLLAGTGMRPSEALGLNWDGVDLKRGRARIETSLRLLPAGRFRLFPLRHPNQRREVLLPKMVITVLREHRSRQRLQQKAAGPAWEALGFVFTTPLGRPMGLSQPIRESLKLLLREAGLPIVSAYSLRHACVVALLGQGVDLQVVSRQTGYAKLGTFLDARRLLA